MANTREKLMARWDIKELNYNTRCKIADMSIWKEYEEVANCYFYKSNGTAKLFDEYTAIARNRVLNHKKYIRVLEGCYNYMEQKFERYWDYNLDLHKWDDIVGAMNKYPKEVVWHCHIFKIIYKTWEGKFVALLNTDECKDIRFDEAMAANLTLITQAIENCNITLAKHIGNKWIKGIEG
jgi:hypothetical protein